MTALLSEYGPRVVKGAMRRMLSDTSAAVRTRLREIPDGEWSETYLLGGLPDRRTRRLRTVLCKEGDVLIRLDGVQAGAELAIIRSQLDELENPSAQNSRTVENLAADTHWPILEHNRERKRRREPRMSLPKHAMADREIIGEDYFFLCLE